MNLAANYLMALAQVMLDKDIHAVQAVIDGEFDLNISDAMVKLGVDPIVAEDVTDRTGW